MFPKSSLALATLSILVLAGCAGPSAPTADTQQADPISARAQFGGGAGGIEGHVLDDSILPVPNATVSLLQLTVGGDPLAETLSGFDGSYQFSHVTPGEYRLGVVAEGFANRSLIVLVEADTVTDTPIILSEVASDDPYALLFIKAGMHTCAGRYVVGHFMNLAFLRSTCGQLYPGEFTSLKFEVPVGHKATVIEFDWQRRQSAGDWGIYGYLGPNGTGGSTQLAAPTDPKAPVFPVVKIVFEPGTAYPRGSLVGGGSYPAFPESSKNFTILAQIIYGGDHVGTMQTVLAPYCATTQCWGVGFEAQWKYTTYGTVFVNETPQGLAEYSAIPDG